MIEIGGRIKTNTIKQMAMFLLIFDNHVFFIRTEGSVVGNYRCQSYLTFSIES